MEDADLIGTGRQAVDPELPERIRHQRRLRALDDHIRSPEISPVQAIDDDAGDCCRPCLGG
jgi:hypothetical protein